MPHRIRTNCLFVIAGLLIATAFAAYGYDLFGSDLVGTATFVSTPDQCAANCDANAACQAWTFVKPPLKDPTHAVCFLKSAVPVPSLNATCTSNAVCLSGSKRVPPDGWCGETPTANVGSSGVQGQGQVLSCPAPKSCSVKVTGGQATWCWFLFFPYPCHAPKIQSTDLFCQ